MCGLPQVQQYRIPDSWYAGAYVYPMVHVRASLVSAGLSRADYVYISGQSLMTAGFGPSSLLLIPASPPGKRTETRFPGLAGSNGRRDGFTPDGMSSSWITWNRPLSQIGRPDGKRCAQTNAVAVWVWRFRPERLAHRRAESSPDRRIVGGLFPPLWRCVGGVILALSDFTSLPVFLLRFYGGNALRGVIRVRKRKLGECFDDGWHGTH